MANFFKFRADHIGSLVPPPEAGADEDAIRALLRMQKDTGVSVATNGGIGRSDAVLARAAADGRLATLLAADTAFLVSNGWASPKLTLPSPTGLLAAAPELDRDEAESAMNAAIRSAFEAGAANVQIDVALDQPIETIRADLAVLQGIDRGAEARLALNASNLALESWDDALLATIAQAPVDRLVLGFHQSPSFDRLAAFQESVDIGLAIVPLNLDEAKRDLALDQVDLAAAVVDGERLSLSPRVALAGSGLDWDAQHHLLWLLTDAAIRWWGFES
jgi:methionine synthase II (cobalamin-independent)